MHYKQKHLHLFTKKGEKAVSARAINISNKLKSAIVYLTLLLNLSN